MIWQIVKGKGVGRSLIDAFDDALYNAGIGNFNLVKVSSIIPADCKKGKIDFRSIPDGSILYIAYEVGYYAEYDDELVVSTVGVRKPVGYAGIIMEKVDYGKSEERVRKLVKRDLDSAFERRGYEGLKIEYDEMESISMGDLDEEEIGCVFTGVALV